MEGGVYLMGEKTNANTDFYYYPDTKFPNRCPMCEEMGIYRFPQESMVEVKPTTLIKLKCPNCNCEYIKYAYVLFGDGKMPEKPE